jgi:site-specific recombinase XerD
MKRLSRYTQLQQWFKEYQTATGRYRPRTIKDYEFELLYFHRWLFENTDIEDIGDITPAIIRQYSGMLFDTGRSAGTIHHKLSALNTFFNDIYKENKFYTDLSHCVELPKRPKRLPSCWLSEGETKTVFTYLEEKTEGVIVNNLEQAILLRDRAVIETIYSTAIRNSELTNLKMAHVPNDQNILMVLEGKGGGDRTSPIGTTAKKIIARYLTEARPILAKELSPDNLFLNRWGGKLTEEGIREIVRRVVKRAGLEKRMTVHGIRHTVATHFLRNGANLRHVQELLGHKDIASTEIYTHIQDSELLDAHKKFHPREQEDFLNEIDINSEEKGLKNGTDID